MSTSQSGIREQHVETRIALAKQFIESVIFGQYRQLVAWKSVTGQSSQLDSGYLNFSPLIGQKRLKFKFNDDVNAVGYGK